jgi:kynureninase
VLCEVPARLPAEESAPRPSEAEPSQASAMTIPSAAAGVGTEGKVPVAVGPPANPTGDRPADQLDPRAADHSATTVPDAAGPTASARAVWESEPGERPAAFAPTAEDRSPGRSVPEHPSPGHSSPGQSEPEHRLPERHGSGQRAPGPIGQSHSTQNPAAQGPNGPADSGPADPGPKSTRQGPSVSNPPRRSDCAAGGPAKSHRASPPSDAPHPPAHRAEPAPHLPGSSASGGYGLNWSAPNRSGPNRSGPNDSSPNRATQSTPREPPTASRRQAEPGDHGVPKGARWEPPNEVGIPPSS